MAKYKIELRAWDEEKQMYVGEWVGCDIVEASNEAEAVTEYLNGLSCNGFDVDFDKQEYQDIYTMSVRSIAIQ